MDTWLIPLKQQLSKQIVANTLPHALVISAVEGVGKEALAQWLITTVICQARQQVNHTQQSYYLTACRQCKTCKLYQAKNYPDHLTINEEKASIGVDAIRKISQFFEKTAHIATTKTVWIDAADLMTVAAANALLKTLEEPTNHSYIILTTAHKDKLLPTIISRCQQFDIRPPAGQALADGFVQQVQDPFVNLSHLAELNDSQVARQYQEFVHNSQQYLCYHQQRSALLAQLVDSDYGLRWLEKLLVDLMRGAAGWKITTTLQQDNAVINNKEQLWQLYQLVLKLNQQLHRVQANKRFLVEKLLVDMSTVIEA